VKPDAVLDLLEVERLPDPDLTGRAAADGEDAGDALALLVVGDGRFSVLGLHGGSCRIWRQFIPGIIDKAIKPG